MVSMLFADVVGYSKFKNEQIVHFVNNYLAMVTHRHLEIYLTHSARFNQEHTRFACTNACE